MQTNNVAVTTNAGRELLTLKLDNCLNIYKGQEIRDYNAVTAFSIIKGVISLNDIVQIVSMRIKYHLGKVSYAQFTANLRLNSAPLWKKFHHWVGLSR